MLIERVDIMYVLFNSTSSSVSGAPKSRIPRPVTSPVRPLTLTQNLTPTPIQRPPIKKSLLPASQLRKPTITPVRQVLQSHRVMSHHKFYVNLAKKVSLSLNVILKNNAGGI